MCPPHVHKLSKHLHTFSSCFTNKLKYLNNRPRLKKMRQILESYKVPFIIHFPAYFFIFSNLY